MHHDRRAVSIFSIARSSWNIPSAIDNQYTSNIGAHEISQDRYRSGASAYRDLL